LKHEHGDASRRPRVNVCNTVAVQTDDPLHSDAPVQPGPPAPVGLAEPHDGAAPHADAAGEARGNSWPPGDVPVTLDTTVPDAVLVVDGDPGVLEVLAGALGKRQLKVRTALCLADAAALAQAEWFGCALIDEAVEGGGLSVVEQVRALQPHCACLVMTAAPSADSILRALRLGAADYLEKPFPSLAMIQEKVVTLIARQRLIADREALVARMEELDARAGQEGVVESARVSLLRHALEVAHRDHARELVALNAAAQLELDALGGRLDAVKLRHQRALAALRQAAASLATLLEKRQVAGAAEQDLRQVRRLLTQVLDER
jgi:DNA-binding response OmpR family regulator